MIAAFHLPHRTFFPNPSTACTRQLASASRIGKERNNVNYIELYTKYYGDEDSMCG